MERIVDKDRLSKAKDDEGQPGDKRNQVGSEILPISNLE